MQDAMNGGTPRALKRNTDSFEDGSFYSSNGPLSPFSPLLRKMRKNRSVKSSGLNEPHVDDDLTLSLCRKVSVVIRVNPATENVDPEKKQMLCIFPLPSDSKKAKKTSKPRASPAEAMLESVSDTRAMVVVNPKAFGRNIRSEITMETAKTVAQLAKISSEDWARLFHFHQVVWPGSSYALRSLVTAMSNDVTATASISSRTVIGMGESSSKMKLLFGNVVRKSIAKVIAGSIDRMTKDDILKEFGLLGLTVSHILDRLPAHAVCTFSMVEIGEDDDFYDLLETHPFPRDAAKKVRIHYPESNRGAVLKSLKETPLDSIKTLGNAVRRAYGFAWHKRRKSPPGHILATVKVYHNANQGDLTQAHTVAQFLDMAVLGNDLAAQARRNGRIRRTQSSLGRLLRNALLKEAGNEATLSYRDCTLTKVLQRSIDHPDSKIVVLSTVSPMVEGYEETMGTLRYATRLLHQPGDALLSPFDATSKTTSPTSPGTTDQSSPISLDRFDKDHLFVGNLVSDPRQRLAKVMKRYRHKVELEAQDMGVEAYIPTQYECVEPSEEARDPPAIKETFDSLLDLSPINALETTPTPLAANRRRLRMFGEEPDAGAFSAPSLAAGLDPKTNGRRAETSYLLDVMERGSDYDYRHEVPSPLTADTGEVYSGAYPYEESYAFDKIADNVLQNKRNFLGNMRGGEIEKEEVKERWRSRDHVDVLGNSNNVEAEDEHVTSVPTVSNYREGEHLTHNHMRYFNKETSDFENDQDSVEEFRSQGHGRQNNTYDDAIIQPIESHSADDEVKYYVSNTAGDSDEGRNSVNEDETSVSQWNDEVYQATRHTEHWLRSGGASIATDAEEMDELSLELRKRCKVMAESTTLSDRETEIDELATELKMKDRIQGSNKENNSYHPLETIEPLGSDIGLKESISSASSQDPRIYARQRRESQPQIEESSTDGHKKYLALVNEVGYEDSVDLRSVDTSSFHPIETATTEQLEVNSTTTEKENVQQKLRRTSEDPNEIVEDTDQLNIQPFELQGVQNPSNRMQHMSASEQPATPNKDKCDLCGDGHDIQELLCNTAPAFMGFSSQQHFKHLPALENVQDEQEQRPFEGGAYNSEKPLFKDNKTKTESRVPKDQTLELVYDSTSETGSGHSMLIQRIVPTLNQDTEAEERYSSESKHSSHSARVSAVVEGKRLSDDLVQPHEVITVENSQKVNPRYAPNGYRNGKNVASGTAKEGMGDAHARPRSKSIAEKHESPTELVLGSTNPTEGSRPEQARRDAQHSIRPNTAESTSGRRYSRDARQSDSGPFFQRKEIKLDNRALMVPSEESKSDDDAEKVGLRGSMATEHNVSHGESISRLDNANVDGENRKSSKLPRYSDANYESVQREDTLDHFGEIGALPATPSRQFITGTQHDHGLFRADRKNSTSGDMLSYQGIESVPNRGTKDAHSPRYSGLHSPRRRISDVHDAIDTLKEVLDRGKVSNIGVFEEGYSTLHELHAFCSTQLDKVRKADAEKDAALQEASRAKHLLNSRSKEYEEELRNLKDTIATLENSLNETEGQRDEIHKIASEAIERQGDLERTVADLKEEMGAMANKTVPIEQYNAVEATATTLAKEIDDVRAEAQFLEAELGDRDMTLSDLQSALREMTDERDAAQQRESQAHTHIESLEAQLEGARNFEIELRQLGKENAQLRSQIEGLENENRRRLEEFRRRLTAKDDYIEELKEELKRVSDEVTKGRKIQQLEENNWKEEKRRLEVDYEELRKQKELAVEENKRARQQLSTQQKRNQGLSSELQMLREQFEVQMSDTIKLSERLDHAENEVEIKDEQIARMKSALSNFQEEMRSRVQQVDMHRKEAADLLEKTLEENKSLTAANLKLQVSLDELKTEQENLAREAQMLRSYASQKESYSRQGDPYLEANFEHLGRPGERRLKPDDFGSHHPSIRDWHGIRKELRQESDLQDIRAEDVAAYVAMSAKSTMEQRSADTYQLRQEINALEDTKDAEIKALKSKIRLLEKRVDESDSRRGAIMMRPGRLLEWEERR